MSVFDLERNFWFQNFMIGEFPAGQWAIQEKMVEAYRADNRIDKMVLQALIPHISEDKDNDKYHHTHCHFNAFHGRHMDKLKSNLRSN